MKLTIKEDFHHGKHYLFSSSYHNITLFEKKYDIKLTTLVSMYHLKSLMSFGRSLKIKMQTQKLLFVLTLLRSILRITTFHGKIL